jgi:peroxisomal enoyl-CoA hydratase 2
MTVSSSLIITPNLANSRFEQSGAYAFGNFSKFDGFVKGFNKDTAPAAPVTALNKVPTRAPDFTFVEATTKEQATIYRLSGDWNPLHIDPAVGKKIGFPGTILHGLCSYGELSRQGHSSLTNRFGRPD